MPPKIALSGVALFQVVSVPALAASSQLDVVPLSQVPVPPSASPAMVVPSQYKSTACAVPAEKMVSKVSATGITTPRCTPLDLVWFKAFAVG